jgi:hypothetical protein
MREQSRAAKIRLLSGDEARQRYDRDLQVIEEEERKQAAAASAHQPIVLVDPSLHKVAANAAKIIRAGLYTKAASRLGAELNKERRPAPARPQAAAPPSTATSGLPTPPVQPEATD